MPKEDNKQNEFILRDVRLSFAHLFKPEKNKTGDKARYKATFLLDPSRPEHKELILKMRARIDELWAEGIKKPGTKAPREKTALRKDGTWDGYEGMWFVAAARAESQNRPKLVSHKKDVDLQENDNRLYSGTYVNAKVRFYFYDYDGTKRVNASIEVVQLNRKGEPFGAGQASADDMPDVEDAPDNDDLDDGIDDDLA